MLNGLKYQKKIIWRMILCCFFFIVLHFFRDINPGSRSIVEEIQLVWRESREKKLEEEEQIFYEDARKSLKVRRSQRLLASKSHEEEEMTFNLWRLTLKGKRTDWIVYVPGEGKIYNSTFDAIKKTLPLKDIQPHPKNTKIFTFQLSKKFIWVLYWRLQKNIYIRIKDSCIILPLVLRNW